MVWQIQTETDNYHSIRTVASCCESNEANIITLAFFLFSSSGLNAQDHLSITLWSTKIL